MIDFFLLPNNTPFVVALAIMFAFTIIEIISASLGMGLSEIVDSVLPEFDADIDIDLDGADSGGANSAVNLLSWFRIGEVPVIMLFIVFLTGFGLSGLAVQYISVSLTGLSLPTFVPVIVAIIASIPIIRVCGGLLASYMPKDETYVVSEESFPGMIATIILGTAEIGKPAQAKLKDKHGQTHYILVEPDNPGEKFATGEKTIIVSQNSSIFKVISSNSSVMTD